MDRMLGTVELLPEDKRCISDKAIRVLEAKAQQRGISYAEMERTAFSYTSIKDYVTPEQIADQILFMCSPRGRTISGQAISICGDTQMLG